ncbi:MAG: hypothetical protein A2Z29_09790 [Chloroflexi bacterium RBG_16_56_11]|nr:MAG: hypothetical protein A2Z29_09790 [Chloroflexi bacterium RBG_16_56_11]
MKTALTRDKAASGSVSGEGTKAASRRPGRHPVDDSRIHGLIAEYSGHVILHLRLVPALKFEYVSPSSYQVIGYHQEELYTDGELLLKCIHPEDVDAFWGFQHPPAIAQEERRAGQEKPAENYHTSLRWLRKDGRIIWTEMNCTIAYDASGQAVAVRIIAHDITERKLAEEKLLESQKFIRSLLENAPHAVVVINPDTSIRYVNPSWEETNGWTLNEVTGLKAPYPWWTDEDRETFSESFKVAMERKGKAEVMARKKTGETYWIEMHWAPVTHRGELQYLLVNSLDITERKLAEQALKESEDKFSRAFHTSPDLMAIVNVESGRFVEVNESFTRFSGYTSEELLGRKVSDFSLWANEEEHALIAGLLAGQGKMRHVEFHLRTKSGEIRTWLSSTDTIKIGNEPYYLIVATDITERKQALEALRESEEKFSKAFNTSPGSISISRLSDSVFIEVNEGFIRDKGYTREEIIGRSALDLNIWTDSDQRKGIIRRLQAGEQVQNERVRFRTKSGEIRTGLVSAELINIGSEPCLIVLNTDITQQQKTEERLRLLSSVTQQVSDSTIVTDLDFKITYLNEAAEKMFGYSASETMGKSLGLFNFKPLREQTSRQIMKTVNSGRVWSGTARKKRKDGTAIYCHCRLSPLYNEKGQIISYIDVEHDVTEQKEMEVKLNDQNRLVESILATMPEGVLVINRNDQIILANQAFYDIFHISKRAIGNKPISDIIPRDKLSNLYMAVLLGQKANNTLEFRYLVGGIEKIITCSIVQMDDERLLLTFIDISQEREEEEKLYLTDRLASLGEMAAGLAHELNNPLTGILSLSQLLVREDMPAEQKEDLQCIYDEAKRAADIVKNVLLFARNNNFENGHASANEVVREVLRLREHQEKTSNISVVTQLQEDLPRIAIDKFQLQQVCLNIILNAEAAIKETNNPGTLTVMTKRVDDNIDIIFSDTGGGIKKNVLPRIFDPFFTTKEIGKGTGLGLSICYGIVVKHGGKIDVRTKVNEGSTFAVRIPVAT